MSGEYGGWGRTSLFMSCIYSWRVLLHWDEPYHGEKLVCHDVWRILAAFFECLVQFNQFLFIVNSCDHLTRFQQLVVYHTFLISPNTQYNLFSMNIAFGVHVPDTFLSFGIFIINPFFITSHSSMQKLLPFASFKQRFPNHFHVVTNFPLSESVQAYVNFCYKPFISVTFNISDNKFFKGLTAIFIE